MRKTIICLFIVFAAASVGSAYALPVLQINGGLLTGAKGVNVNGVLYDVEFRDGTCIELFSGCDSLGDFTFIDSTATAASQALLDQVFLDGPLGNFDTKPSLIRGCFDNTGQGFCAVFTPVDFRVNNIYAQNSTAEAFDLTSAAFTLPNNDLTPFDTNVYAVWSPAVTTPVAEPNSVTLLITGGLALNAVRKRAKRISHFNP